MALPVTWLLSGPGLLIWQFEREPIRGWITSETEPSAEMEVVRTFPVAFKVQEYGDCLMHWPKKS